MDSLAQQHKEMGGSNSLENMLVCSKQQNQERKARPPQEEALKCPRCDSINTKFCYYNNYSLSQPRYFCKSCRRYWTKGGTLRNVPVGGGCRKNKRSSSSSSSSSTSSSTSNSARKTQLDPHLISSSNPLLSSLTPPHLTYDSNDLTLAFARLQKQPHLGFDDHLSILGNPPQCDILGNPNPSFLGFLENQNNFQNGFYGHANNNNMGEIEDQNEMVMPYDHHQDVSTSRTPATTQAVTVTTMKQEFCNFGREDEGKILWGFPWQNINGNGTIGDLDSGRESSWNNINIHGIGSAWHGVLNTPLM